MAWQPPDEPASLQMLLADPRLAVQEDCIVCLICGGRLRQLTNTHLLAHATDVAAYRTRFGYNRRRALMCLALRRFYAERAVRSGLADRIQRRPIMDTPELRRLGGAPGPSRSRSGSPRAAGSTRQRLEATPGAPVSDGNALRQQDPPASLASDPTARARSAFERRRRACEDFAFERRLWACE